MYSLSVEEIRKVSKNGKVLDQKGFLFRFMILRKIFETSTKNFDCRSADRDVV